MRNRSLWIGNLLLFLAVPLCAFILADDAGNKPPLKIPKCPENSIRIDGLLKEKAWQTAAKIQLLFEIYPSKNTSAIQKTECYLTYDTQHLYVAFIAWDQSPESIRAHLSDRDSITEDDQVGFYLDTFNDEHKGYSFFVNPWAFRLIVSGMISARERINPGTQSGIAMESSLRPAIRWNLPSPFLSSGPSRETPLKSGDLAVREISPETA